MTHNQTRMMMETDQEVSETSCLLETSKTMDKFKKMKNYCNALS